jgi:hypothetical protein
VSTARGLRTAPDVTVLELVERCRARLEAAGGRREGDLGGQLTVDVRSLPATAPLLAAVAAGNDHTDLWMMRGTVVF